MSGLIYLHGFASGPKGHKARHCKDWAQARDIPFLAPDLNLPTFERLTISAQVDAVESMLNDLPGNPVVVGSSLGGMVGAAVANRGAHLKKLILLAPGFGFARRRLDSSQWACYRKYKKLPVYHQAYQRWMRLGSELLEDLPKWRDDDTWNLKTPLVILHGRRDEVVPAAESAEFIDRHPEGALHIVDDDHQMRGPSSLKLLDQELTKAFEND